MNRLWYKSPAKDWNEALPVGNGRIGGMVYGNLGHEIIQLNEESIWSGPYRDRNNYSCKSNLEKIRTLIDQGRIEEAQELGLESMTGCPSQQTVYQTAGNLHIDYYTAEKTGLTGPLPDRKDVFEGASGYVRELNLDTAIASTSFSKETKVPSTAIFGRNSHGSSIEYKREVFVSAVEDVMVIHITASTPKSIYFRAYLDRDDFTGNLYSMNGDTIAMDASNCIPFCVMAMATTSNGSVETRGNFLIVEGADEATIFLDIETAYRNRFYRRSGGNTVRTAKSLISWCMNEATKKLCFASSAPYSDIRNYHVEEYSSFYRRTKLNLSGENPEESNIATDELLKSHSDSPALTELYWNFGRYLLLSSSRKPGTLPANLQGIWNKDFLPPWGSKFTINVNTEMNYWPANMLSLEETELPFFDLLKKARKHGKKTAGAMYGCDGFVAHHNLDIWGDTAPQDKWIPGTYWVLGAAWMATHIREHFEYTRDTKFLKKNFKILKDATDFFCDYLVPSSDGKHLVVSPSVSPENSFRLPSGETGCFSAGTDMDNRILEHLFNSAIQSALDLGKKSTDRDILKWKNILEKIEPPAITKDGCIREWPIECEEVEPGHRHISQLYGLFPGHSINVNKTPELAKAASATIEKRLANGGGHTGWSQAWIMNFRASLHQSDEAYKSLVSLFEKSTQPNLFDSHPPFQIDGNFGATAAITRMIVQSEMDGDKVVVDILPALPEKWARGNLDGLALKGNLKMNIAWENGHLKSGEIFAQDGRTYVKKMDIIYNGKRYEAPIENGHLNIKNILPTTI